MTNNSVQHISWVARLRRGALWLLFALVLLIPKLIALRRRFRLWSTLRAAAVVAGLGLAAIGWMFGESGTLAVLGIVMALLGLAMPPERHRLAVDERARELGALVVVHGGRYVSPDGTTAVRLFVGAERLWVVEEASLRALAEIPLTRVSCLGAAPITDSRDQIWRLQLTWEESKAVFEYRGVFAEHLAQVAESTVRAQMGRRLPVLP